MTYDATHRAAIEARFIELGHRGANAELTHPDREEWEQLRAEIENYKAPIVREFSLAGPCITLGRLRKETAQFYFYEEWQGGNVYRGLKRVKKGGRAHVEPCHSCRDHEHTQYPDGYMD